MTIVRSRQFCGSWIARVTKKGRLRVPNNLGKVLEHCRSNFYATSATGDHAKLYPMEAWQGIEDKLALISSTNRAKRKYLMRTTYFGQQTAFQSNGVQLPEVLRESAKLSKEAIIVGADDHLRVYSLEYLNDMVRLGRLKLEEMGSIAELDPTNTANNSILAAIDLPRRQELLEVLATCRTETALYIARHSDTVFDVNPRVFEVIIAEVMKSCGFDVELTAQTRDGGVDIIAVHKDVFGIPTRYVVECKKWASKKRVSIDLVRALYGAKQIHGADHAIFVTTASFTQDTWNLSKTGQLRNLTLVDFERLQQWFREFVKSQDKKLQDDSLQIDKELSDPGF